MIAIAVEPVRALTTISDSCDLIDSRTIVDHNLDDVPAITAPAGVPPTVGIGLARFCPDNGDVPVARVAAAREAGLSD